jgi:acyl-CoA thioesterase-2
MEEMKMIRNVLEELVQQLALERIEANLFRGQSQDPGWGAVFGGQVLGQALSAAVQTVPEPRRVHSLHAYFLRSGDVTKPIVYDVDRIRDGGSFTTRRVVAIQNGEPIFNMAASFQADEPGFDHHDEMPEAPDPLTEKTERERALPYADRLPKALSERVFADRPFELRPVGNDNDPFDDTPKTPRCMVWLKAVGRLPDDPSLHHYLLAYASDHSLIATALRPHGVSWLTPGMQVASLDHVMWFHRPFRVDEWLLYVLDSPSAHGGRGLARGRVFSQDGKLVASVMQEGLVRRRST